MAFRREQVLLSTGKPVLVTPGRMPGALRIVFSAASGVEGVNVLSVAAHPSEDTVTVAQCRRTPAGKWEALISAARGDRGAGLTRLKFVATVSKSGSSHAVLCHLDLFLKPCEHDGGAATSTELGHQMCGREDSPFWTLSHTVHQQAVLHRSSAPSLTEECFEAALVFLKPPALSSSFEKLLERASTALRSGKHYAPNVELLEALKLDHWKEQTFPAFDAIEGIVGAARALAGPAIPAFLPAKGPVRHTWPVAAEQFALKLCTLDRLESLAQFNELILDTGSGLKASAHPVEPDVVEVVGDSPEHKQWIERQHDRHRLEPGKLLTLMPVDMDSFEGAERTFQADILFNPEHKIGCQVLGSSKSKITLKVLDTGDVGRLKRVIDSGPGSTPCLLADSMSNQLTRMLYEVLLGRTYGKAVDKAVSGETHRLPPLLAAMFPGPAVSPVETGAGAAGSSYMPGEDVALRAFHSGAAGGKSLSKTELTTDQKAAIGGCLLRPRLRLIRGPPGTGKTATLVELILQVTQSPHIRCLVVGHSNSSVDGLLLRLLKANPDFPPGAVLRWLSSQRNRVKMRSSLSDAEIDVILDVAATVGSGRGRIPSVPTFRQLHDAKVVLATVNTASRLVFSREGPPFDFVIVDEASTPSEAELLCLLSAGIGSGSDDRSLKVASHFVAKPGSLTAEAVAAGVFGTLPFGFGPDGPVGHPLVESVGQQVLPMLRLTGQDTAVRTPKTAVAPTIVLCGDHKQLNPVISSGIVKWCGGAISTFERMLGSTVLPEEEYVASVRNDPHEGEAAAQGPDGDAGPKKKAVRRKTKALTPAQRAAIALKESVLAAHMRARFPGRTSASAWAANEAVRAAAEQLCRPSDVCGPTPYAQKFRRRLAAVGKLAGDLRERATALADADCKASDDSREAATADSGADEAESELSDSSDGERAAATPPEEAEARVSESLQPLYDIVDAGEPSTCSGPFLERAFAEARFGPSEHPASRHDDIRRAELFASRSPGLAESRKRWSEAAKLGRDGDRRCVLLTRSFRSPVSITSVWSNAFYGGRVVSARGATDKSGYERGRAAKGLLRGKLRALGAHHLTGASGADVAKAIFHRFPELEDHVRKAVAATARAGENNRVIFVAVRGVTQRDPNEPSTYNDIECNVTASLAQSLTSLCTGQHLGICTPYWKQAVKMTEVMHRFASKEFVDAMNISTVNKFQGDEKSIVFVSTVRAGSTAQEPSGCVRVRQSEASQVGFLRNPRRANVAISRARDLLVLVGDPGILLQSKEWSSVVATAALMGGLWNLSHTVPVVADGVVDAAPPTETRVPAYSGAAAAAAASCAAVPPA